MAVIAAPGNLCTALAGNVTSTNTIQRLNFAQQPVLKITNTAGATPTVTINIQGSFDNVTFFNLPYATTAAPQTAVLAAIVVTVTATNFYILQSTVPWLYLNIVMSLNTNETITADLL